MYEFLQETVAENMTRNVRTVEPETTVADLYRLFAVDNFDAYPVVHDDVLVGIVSKLDALKIFALAKDHLLPRYSEGMATPVDAIMTASVIAVDSEAKLQRALELMVSHRMKSIPVTDRQNRLVGIVAREDVMKAMQRAVVGQYPPALPFETV